MTDLDGWIPIRIHWRKTGPMVDWGFLGERRFTDPFFAQTIDSCVRHPADLLFRHETPIEALEELAVSRPGLSPTGFIFHMSRCGSTLVSQMLAASSRNLVLSEPGPIDDVLRVSVRDPEVGEDRLLLWLRWLVSALTSARHPAEQNLFIKFDCWHTMFLPLIRRAYPEVPWIFLYRDPIEVMASAEKRLGGHMIPGVLEPALFGWTPAQVGAMNVYEYTARVLARICEAALVAAQAGDGKLVNYRQLPARVWPDLMRYWNVAFPAEECDLMLAAARLDSKNPVLTFEADDRAKRESISADLRVLTRTWLDEVHASLEAARCAKGFA